MCIIVPNYILIGSIEHTCKCIGTTLLAYQNNTYVYNNYNNLISLLFVHDLQLCYKYIYIKVLHKVAHIFVHIFCGIQDFLNVDCWCLIPLDQLDRLMVTWGKVWWLTVSHRRDKRYCMRGSSWQEEWREGWCLTAVRISKTRDKIVGCGQYWRLDVLSPHV